MALSEGNIRGECGSCHLVYDLFSHAMLCPRCKSTDILWATNLDAKEIRETWNPEAAHARIREDDWDRMHELRRKLYWDGHMYTDGLSKGDLKDIAELMKMMTLEDTREA